MAKKEKYEDEIKEYYKKLLEQEDLTLSEIFDKATSYVDYLESLDEFRAQGQEDDGYNNIMVSAAEARSIASEQNVELISLNQAIRTAALAGDLSLLLEYPVSQRIRNYLQAYGFKIINQGDNGKNLETIISWEG